MSKLQSVFFIVFQYLSLLTVWMLLMARNQEHLLMGFLRGDGHRQSRHLCPPIFFDHGDLPHPVQWRHVFSQLKHVKTTASRCIEPNIRYEKHIEVSDMTSLDILMFIHKRCIFQWGKLHQKWSSSHQGILPIGTYLALRLHWLEASAIPIDEVLHLHDIHVFDHPLLLWQHEPGQPTSNCHSSSQQKTYKHGGWKCLLGFVMNSIAIVSHLSTWEHHAARIVSWACCT